MKSSICVILLTVLVAILVANIGMGLKTSGIEKSAPTSLIESAEGDASTYSNPIVKPELGNGYLNVDEIISTHHGFNEPSGYFTPEGVIETQHGSNPHGYFGPESQLNGGYSFSRPGVVSEIAPATMAYIGRNTNPPAPSQPSISKYLWIESDNKLQQFASIPQYTNLSLLAYTSTGGMGEIVEMYPSSSNQGIYQMTLYNFNPGYNQINYRGEVAGRHRLLFTMSNESSNGIIIQVDKATIGDSSVVLGTTPSQGA